MLAPDDTNMIGRVSGSKVGTPGLRWVLQH